MKRKSDKRRKVEHGIQELAALVKAICPDATMRVIMPGYEDYDAWLTVIVPDERFDEVDEALRQRRKELEARNGYLIGLNIVERSAVKVPSS